MHSCTCRIFPPDDPDLARRRSTHQRHYLVIESRETRVVFLNQPRLELALAIPRRLQFDFAELAFRLAPEPLS